MRAIYVISKARNDDMDVVRDVEPFFENMRNLGCTVNEWNGKRCTITDPFDEIIATVFKAGMDP